MDLCGWEDKDEDLAFAQDTSLSGQFAQQWTLRMRAQEVASKEIANGKLWRLLAFNKPFTCTDVKIGDAALFYKTQSNKSAPRRRRDGEVPVANFQSCAVLRVKERAGDGCGRGSFGSCGDPIPPK